MKKYIKISFIAGLLISLFSSCNDLDLVALDQAASSTWFSNETEFREYINDGYREVFWFEPESDDYSSWTDDSQYRDSQNQLITGTINPLSSAVAPWWSNSYKAIARVLIVIEELEKQDVLSEKSAKQFTGEANFLRGCFYSNLITLWGDVPFYEKPLTLDESYDLARTGKMEILAKIYQYFDIAAANLPKTYGTGQRYATQGAALAYKARIALRMGDYNTAATAAKACIDLGAYSLHPDYEKLFLPETKNSPEVIFHMPRNIDLGASNTGYLMLARRVEKVYPRTRGGFGQNAPTWALLASYECTDGLPIDESPLFDPRNPFKDRDPRCGMTIVPFGSLKEGDGRTPDAPTLFMDMMFTSHPKHKQLLDVSTGKMLGNSDTRSFNQWASFNSLYWKKGITRDYEDKKTAPDRILMRLADVYLMYAEAKIELNQIDATVTDALNRVRARAYGYGSNVASYVDKEKSAIKITDQNYLRKKVRNERRVELAFEESIRFYDIMRWRLAEKVFRGPIYATLLAETVANVNVPPTGPVMDILVNKGLYFWAETPPIDEDGIADFTGLLQKGYCRSLGSKQFDAKAYLMPIPQNELDIMPNMKQNPGY